LENYQWLSIASYKWQALVMSMTSPGDQTSAYKLVGKLPIKGK
jgi:hypothetical protein